MKVLKEILLWGWPVALAVLLVGFLVPFPRTVDVTTAAVIWDGAGPGNETLLDRASFSIQGRCDRYLFRDDTFSGTLIVTPETAAEYALSISIEHMACLPVGEGLCLSAGYVTNGGSVRTFSLWFDKALRYFELLPSAYPSSVRVSAPSATLDEARAVFPAIYLDGDAAPTAE